MTRISEIFHGWLGWCPNGKAIPALRRSSTSNKDQVVLPVDRNTRHPDPSLAGTPGNLPYEHTQRGDMIIGIFSFVILLMLATQIMAGFVWVGLLVLGILAGALVTFSTLTVTVDNKEIRIRFGPVGLLKKSWQLAEIESVTPVTNPWYYGLGIHWTPQGVLYNVSGFRGVGIRLYSGTLIRIGSDEPEALCSAIQTACRTSTGGKHP